MCQGENLISCNTKSLLIYKKCHTVLLFNSLSSTQRYFIFFPDLLFFSNFYSPLLQTISINTLFLNYHKKICLYIREEDLLYVNSNDHIVVLQILFLTRKKKYGTLLIQLKTFDWKNNGPILFETFILNMAKNSVCNYTSGGWYQVWKNLLTIKEFCLEYYTVLKVFQKNRSFNEAKIASTTYKQNKAVQTGITLCSFLFMAKLNKNENLAANIYITKAESEWLFKHFLNTQPPLTVEGIYNRWKVEYFMRNVHGICQQSLNEQQLRGVGFRTNKYTLLSQKPLDFAKNYVAATNGTTYVTLHNEQDIIKTGKNVVAHTRAGITGIDGWQVASSITTSSTAKHPAQYIGFTGVFVENELKQNVSTKSEIWPPIWVKNPTIGNPISKEELAIHYHNPESPANVALAEAIFNNASNFTKKATKKYTEAGTDAFQNDLTAKELSSDLPILFYVPD